MKRGQRIILILMGALAAVLFCGVIVISRSLFLPTNPDALAQQAQQTAEAKATVLTLPTAIPTATYTPSPAPTHTATNTPIPTATPTRVVKDTATPTPSNTPTSTATPTVTPTNTRVVPVTTGGGGGGGGGGGTGGGAPAPTATPASLYPFVMTGGPLSYPTSNHIFVILAQVKVGTQPLEGYKLVGTHSPTGFQWESVVSCPDLCKASGPEAIYDENGELVEKFQIQKGNLVLESPAYDTGVWSLMLVDSMGRQVSDVFQLALDSTDKYWFYYEFSRY